MVTDTRKKLIKVSRQIFNNHPDLYLQSDEMYRRIFAYQETEMFKNISKKYAKYKKLYNLFLVISIVEFVIVVIVVLLKTGML